MIILITGANFNNKGAQLMLYTLNENIKRYLPQAIVCVSPLLGNLETLQKLNIKTLNFPLYHYGIGRKFKLPFIFPNLVKLYLRKKGIFSSGEIALTNVNVVMDISGYAFGDKWGNLPTENLLYFINKMKINESKFLLLPQAFGPFSNSQIKGDIRKIIQNVDLIFAREQASFEFLNENIGTNKNLYIAPDITLTFNQYTEKVSNLPPDFCIIVPNSQMLIRANQSWKESYIDVLERVTNLILQNSKLNVMVLIHAQKDGADAKIGTALYNKYKEQFSKRIYLYHEDDPLKIKSIIAKALFLFGSRFHALASALSSNVPCISTSWLHKYEMLFSEYKCDGYNFIEPTDSIYNKIKELLVEEKRKNIQHQLIEINNTIKEKNNEMWQLILDKIQ